MGRVLRADGVMVALGVTVFLLVFGLLGGPSAATRWVGAGVVLAPVFMAYVHRTAAARASVVAAVVWPFLSAPVLTTLIVWAYAAACVAVVYGVSEPGPELAVYDLAPQPATRPEVGGRLVKFAVALLALAALMTVLHWLGPAIVFAALAVALKERVSDDQKAVRDLFRKPQPMHEVRVLEQNGYVHLLLPAPDGETALEFGIDTAPQLSDLDEDLPWTLPGTLYGPPRPGGWCAVAVEGRVHAPIAPVRSTKEIPYDVEAGLPLTVPDQTPDEDELLDEDQTADAFAAREFRISPHRAWTATIAIGLAAALATGFLARLGGTGWPGTALLVTLAAAGGYEYGWHSQLRPRLRWHAGGVASVGFGAPARTAWIADSAVRRDDDGSVLLEFGRQLVTVPVPAPWPNPQAQRSADELVAALRDARTRSFEIVEHEPPPQIGELPRPPQIYAAWLISIVVTLLVIR